MLSSKVANSGVYIAKAMMATATMFKVVPDCYETSNYCPNLTKCDAQTETHLLC
jgi:hypothetical protein